MGDDLLLDTHTFLWWATDDRRLSSRACAALAGGHVLLSVVTPWELIVKQAIGRLELLDPPRALVRDLVARHGFDLLPISLEHVLAAGELPLHHGDPFDRLLIAQGRAEGLTLVTSDAVFGDYDVAVLW